MAAGRGAAERRAAAAGVVASETGSVISSLEMTRPKNASMKLLARRVRYPAPAADDEVPSAGDKDDT